MEKETISEPIKLVIWDMDNTFWKGIISEEEVTAISDNIRILDELLDRGIISGISSKNDFDVVEKKLIELGVSEKFVFKLINWEPKGVQIREKLKEYGLRSVNVLFIDDDIKNLNEVAFFNPGIAISGPEILTDNRLLSFSCFAGKNDFAHGQLTKYRILETKSKNRRKYSDDEEFLAQSGIRVTLNIDCSAQKERIFELIQKTNQLNYTKNRSTYEELEEAINNPRHNCGYVEANDKYGEYGIVGFWDLIGDRLIHFLFSCRIIGMGIEQWVYAKLGYPNVEIRGEVAGTLTDAEPPYWINQDNGGRVNRIRVGRRKHSILMRGGCDLSQMLSYMDEECFDVEFNNLSHHRDHSVFLRGMLDYDTDEKEYCISNFPFLGKNTFESDIYTGKHDVIVYSLLMDYSENVYKVKKKQHLKVAYGDFLLPYKFEGEFERENKDEGYYREELESIGRISDDEFIGNLEHIVKNIGEDVVIVFINGCEMESPYELERNNDRSAVHKHMNYLVDRFIQMHENTRLLDMRKIVTKDSDLKGNIRHYKRHIYYKMAIELKHLLDECGT